jgi:hypothetical protein
MIVPIIKHKQKNFMKILKYDLPKMNMDLSETGCCPKFDPKEWWDGRTIKFEEKLFVKMKTCNFMYVPLNMGRVMGKTWKKVKAADAGPKDYYLLLSHDPSPWKAYHYMAVEKEVEGLEHERISGEFVTKVFEGDFKNAGKWAKEMGEFVKSKNCEITKLYFFYTTCPKCIKHWGKNYVVAFAQID